MKITSCITVTRIYEEEQKSMEDLGENEISCSKTNFESVFLR